MKIRFVFIILALSLIITCKNDDDSGPEASTSVNDFIWKSMNLWYYWQEDVADLADDRFQSNSDYSQFLNSQQPDELFFNLLYNYGNIDRFSWIVEDYHDLDNAFAGINKTFGMDYGLVYESINSNQIIGYVQYVLPNSPAANAGFERGDIITRINGTQLTDQNYSELLGQETATFGLGYIQDGQIFDLNEHFTITKVQMQENPVYLTQVLNLGGHKIGYLVYNGFRANFNDELNSAIGQLKSQGITDLVLDLRYNGGGSVQTSAYLGSMITGQFNQQDFTKLTFNSKTDNNNSTYKFENQGKIFNDELEENGSFSLEHLQLSKLYVLTSGNTASASEMLISCLKPYIEVETIGTKTFGKTVGSITLYDSPEDYYTSTDHINPAHTWAMQPIVFEYKNSQNQSSPSLGIIPNHEINEIQYLEDLQPLGDEAEPLLAAAIMSILNNPMPKYKAPLLQTQMLRTSQNMEKWGTEMYLDKGFEFKL